MGLDLRIAADPEALAEAAAGLVVETLGKALEVRPRARWVLAGGTTPLALYRRLASEPAALDWSRVDFYWGDERCVDPADDASNFRAARRTLLDPLRIDPAHRFRIRGDWPPEAAAERYGAEIEAALRDGDWDLVLLGLGDDGHTASLFPPRGGDEIPVGRAADTPDWAVVTEAPSPPRVRVSMTLQALMRSRRTLFVASGSNKAPALERVFAADPELHASVLGAMSPGVTWCVDRAAAGKLAPTVQSGGEHEATDTSQPEEL